MKDRDIDTRIEEILDNIEEEVKTIRFLVEQKKINRQEKARKENSQALANARSWYHTFIASKKQRKYASS